MYRLFLGLPISISFFPFGTPAFSLTTLVNCFMSSLSSLFSGSPTIYTHFEYSSSSNSSTVIPSLLISDCFLELEYSNLSICLFLFIFSDFRLSTFCSRSSDFFLRSPNWFAILLLNSFSNSCFNQAFNMSSAWTRITRCIHVK